MLSRYKEWVKRHPGVVQNLDWLLLFTVWNPSRTNGGFEFTYEAYHAAVGLLSLWHQNILEEDELPTSRPAPYLWLDAIEHLETLIELRGMHLENQGKMSRYGPLLAVEVVKAILKMAAWSRYSGHMFLRRPTPDDLHQFESEQGMQDILASLDRLQGKYTASSASASTSAAQPPLASCCGGGAQPGCALAPPGAAATLAPPSGCGAAAGGGGSGCAACSGGGGNTYGLREYVGEWAATLVPQQLRRGAGGGGGGGSGRCQKPSQPKDVRATAATAAEEQQQQQQQCRVVSESGCSTSPRCGAAAVTARAEDCCCPGGESRWRQQQQQQWQAARWQWGQQLQDAGPQAGGSPRPAGLGLGLGMRAAGAGEDPDAHMGRNLLWLSELLYIWRPVVYVTMLKRYGRRSWRPWATSLAVDLLSGHFHRRGRKHLAEAEARAEAEAVAAAAAAASDGGGDGDGGEVKAAAVAALMPALYGKGTSLLSLALARSLAAPGITAGEERELYDRRRKLALYLLRSPFLEATTLSWLAFLRDSTRKVPLLGFGADYLYGLVETFTAYYCYTSGSN